MKNIRILKKRKVFWVFFLCIFNQCSNVAADAGTENDTILASFIFACVGYTKRNNNNNNKSNFYSAIRHKQYPHSAVHSHNIHSNAVCACMNLHETII